MDKVHNHTWRLPYRMLGLSILGIATASSFLLPSIFVMFRYTFPEIYFFVYALCTIGAATLTFLSLTSIKRRLKQWKTTWTFLAASSIALAGSIYAVSAWKHWSWNSFSIQQLSVVTTGIFCFVAGFRATSINLQIALLFARIGVAMGLIVGIWHLASIVFSELRAPDGDRALSFALSVTLVLALITTKTLNSWLLLAIVPFAALLLSDGRGAIFASIPVVLLGTLRFIARQHSLRVLIPSTLACSGAILALAMNSRTGLSNADNSPLAERLEVSGNPAKIAFDSSGFVLSIVEQTIEVLPIGLTGRGGFWLLTIASLQRFPISGGGPGSASFVVNNVFPGMEHPHNDWLRISHDYGIPALLLAVSIAALIAAQLCSRVVQNHSSSVLWGALGAYSALLLGMVWDNVLVYPFICLPLSYLLGLAFSSQVNRNLRVIRE
jgi:hypothetical protein